MSNQTISELAAGGALQAGDETIIARSGSNYSILLGTIATQNSNSVSITGGQVNNALINTALGSSIASAATLNLDTATGNTVHVTGTTGITAVTLTLGTRQVIFDGILTITAGSNLILPAPGNITTAAGDTAMFAADTAGAVHCLWYQPKSGNVSTSGGTITGTLVLSGAPLNEATGTAVASATTVNLTTATGNSVHITGTTAITGITLGSGFIRYVTFDGILTLTNGASLLLPGGANITTAAGDRAIFQGDATGVVRCLVYTPASGQAVIHPYLNLTGGTLTGALNEAQATPVASATTVDLDAATGNIVHITGTTTITGVTLTAGIRYVVFNGILTLTNGSNLLLPGAADITTAAGDCAIMWAEPAGVVRVGFYQRASVAP